MNELVKCGPCRKCIKRAQEIFHQGLFKGMIEAKEVDNGAATKDTESEGRVAREVKDTTELQPGTSNQEDDNRRMTRQSFPYTPWASWWTTAELQTLQYEDPNIGPILQARLTGIRPSNKDMVCKSPAYRHNWILWDLLTVHQGLLFKKFLKKDGTGESQQFVVPRVLKKDLMFQMNDSVISGHLRCKKTKVKTQQRFYWYSMKENITYGNMMSVNPLRNQLFCLGLH